MTNLSFSGSKKITESDSNEFLFIPFGDHCAPAILLQELGIRQASFPFDWVVHIDEFSGTSIPVILSLCKYMLDTANIDCLLQHFLPYPKNYDINLKSVGPLRNWIRFPHDKFWQSSLEWQDEYQKYKRRFIRLYKNIVFMRPIIYVCICRSYLLSPSDCRIIDEYLLGFNPNSWFIFITGQDLDNSRTNDSRIVQASVPYRRLTPAYVEYSDRLYLDNDIAYWRINLKTELSRLIQQITNQVFIYTS